VHSMKPRCCKHRCARHAVWHIRRVRKSCHSGEKANEHDQYFAVRTCWKLRSPWYGRYTSKYTRNALGLRVTGPPASAQTMAKRVMHAAAMPCRHDMIYVLWVMLGIEASIGKRSMRSAQPRLPMHGAGRDRVVGNLLDGCERAQACT